jgi:hypothetical protein
MEGGLQLSVTKNSLFGHRGRTGKSLNGIIQTEKRFQMTKLDFVVDHIEGGQWVPQDQGGHIAVVVCL